ncbi:MAG: DUF3012 domain-containing protein [Rhodospirillaceae bacterium]|nr:DUF3012 domain-containing protein [Rhodospirillaceae bacterium]MBL6930666.1 DUF3012 domain-containing protein [Rhodospirillales bacterium]
MFLNFKRIVIAISGMLAITAMTACSPEVGSKEWCDDLKEKPKGDWSSNEAADFAKNCVF